MTDFIEITRGTQTFRFSPQSIERYAINVTTDIDEIKMPASGPGGNFAFDSNGVMKQVTITGRLVDSIGGSYVTGSGAPSITTKELAKIYLESYQTGFQVSYGYKAPNDDAILLTGTGTTRFNEHGNIVTSGGQLIPGTWVTPRCYITSLTVDGMEGNPDAYVFSMTILVVGQSI